MITVSLKSKLRHILRLDRPLALVWKSARGWTVAGMALILIQSILPLGLLYLTKLVIDAVTEGAAAGGGINVFRRVVLLIGLTAIVALLEVACRSVSGIVNEAQSQAIADHVHDVLHSKSIEVDLEYYENPQYYDTLHRAQQEAPYRPGRIVSDLMKVAQSGITMFVMIGLLFSFHWSITAILFVAVIPGILVRLKYSNKMYRWRRERTLTERQVSYLNRLLTGKTHAKELRLFELGPLFKDRSGTLRRQLRGEKLGIAVRRSAAELMTQAAATLAVFGSYAFIACRTVQGAISLGSMVMYYQAFQRAQNSFRNILTSLTGLYEDNLFLSNFYDFLDLEQKVAEPEHPRPMPRAMREGIVFDRLSFRYPMSDRDVLRDITMTVRPGEHIALVGENGAGKTTLIKLLCRLYDPLSGRISVDGIDLRDLNTAEWRREISAVFQDYAKYNTTARENIWFGDVNIPPDDNEKIRAAARHSGADDVITYLSDGYETILGKMFEKGEELSMGEWQKVALARAFLRDSQILILDEPTSSLDVRTEYEIFKRFHQLAAGKTVILISHRMSTVRMADRIFVLKDGVITESGTHDELIFRDGEYARSFEMQSQHYR